MEDISTKNGAHMRAEKALKAAPAFAAAAFAVLLVAFYVSLMSYRASIDADARRELGARAELAAMTLYYTIYGEFINDKVTYAQAKAAGVTTLETEAEWRQLAAYLRRTVSKGLTVTIR